MRHIERTAEDAYVRAFSSRPRVLASAPGRVNLIGEHTDYNEGFVLPCAIDLRVAVAIDEGPGGLYSVDYQEVLPTDGCGEGTWADYPRGVAWALAETGIAVPRFQAAIAGEVPRGSGLSSSAAIESAVALALCQLVGAEVDRKRLALTCQRAENGFVGVNSGVMDQYASLMCRAREALFIDCRTLDATPVSLDLEGAGLALVVCDTGVDRSLASSGYNDRRTTCEAAARKLGVPTLRDATLDDLGRLSGLELARARHVVTENARVLEAVASLERGDFETFGRLMYASHVSLREDYAVSSPELDAFVDVASQVGAVGARLTGAGFGGCAIALTSRETAEALTVATRERFALRRYREPTFYAFSPADGAALIG